MSGSSLLTPNCTITRRAGVVGFGYYFYFYFGGISSGAELSPEDRT